MARLGPVFGTRSEMIPPGESGGGEWVNCWRGPSGREAVVVTTSISEQYLTCSFVQSLRVSFAVCCLLFSCNEGNISGSIPG